jgi:hypothetical protein
MVQAGVRLLDVGSCFDPIREILKKGSEGPKFPVNVEVRCHGKASQPIPSRGAGCALPAQTDGVYLFAAQCAFYPDCISLSQLPSLGCA